MLVVCAPCLLEGRSGGIRRILHLQAAIAPRSQVTFPSPCASWTCPWTPPTRTLLV